MTDQECPYCKSTDILEGERYTEQSMTTRSMGCESCDGEFTFIYSGTDCTSGELEDVIEEFNPVPSRRD